MTANRLQSRGGAGFVDHNPAVGGGIDFQRPPDVGQLQSVRQFVAAAYGRVRRRYGSGRGFGSSGWRFGRRFQRFGGLVVDPPRGNRYQFPFRVAQGGQPTAEDAAGVHADGVVHPAGFGGRRVAVYYCGDAPVVLRPVHAYRQVPFVQFAVGLSVQAEIADPAGVAVLVRHNYAGVGDSQFAVVQQVLDGAAVFQKVGDLLPVFGAADFQLRDGFGQAVGHRDVAAHQVAFQLGFVIAQQAEGAPGAGHADDGVQYPVGAGSPVHQVAQKDGRASFGMAGCVVLAHAVAQPVQQSDQFVETAVYIADDVERAVQFLPVAAGFGPAYGEGGGFVPVFDLSDTGKTFAA